jgi:hypothetical protein
MTPALLVETLRARGVVLRAVGDRLRVHPADAVTAEEVAALRLHKAAVLALLARVTTITLDRVTIMDVLGPQPDPHDLASVRLDVMQAVAQLEREIQAGALGQTPLLVRGHPLGDWLDLAEVARLLRAGKARS